MTPRVQLIVGLLQVAVGQLAVGGLAPGSPAAVLLPGLLLTRVANRVLNAALGRQALASVPIDRAAMGTGANNTARYVGSARGIAVTILLTGPAAEGPAGLISGWHTAVLVTVGFSVLGALTVLLAREQQALSRAEP